MQIYFKPPYFLPSLNFFYALAHADLWVVLDHQKYTTRSYQNACKIKNKDTNHYTMMRVPIGYPATRPLHQIPINNFLPWKKRILSTIKLNYESTDFYETYFGELQSHINSPVVMLETLNMDLVMWISDLLNISPVYMHSRTHYDGSKKQAINGCCARYNAEPFKDKLSIKDKTIRDKESHLSTIHYLFLYGAKKVEGLIKA